MEQQNKWYKQWQFIFFVLVLIVAIILFVGLTQPWNWNCWNCGGTHPNGYNTAREQIQNAVTAYSANQSNNGSLPTFDNTTWNGTCKNLSSPLYIVNINALLASNGGMLRTYLDGIYAGSGTNSDNFNGSVPNSYKGGHYLWIMDQSGTVASICIGNACKAANVSGYQDVWP